MTVVDTIKTLFTSDPGLLSNAIRNCPLSEEFVEQFADIINWSELLEWQRFPESFIRKFINKVDLTVAFNRQTLSEQFIEDYARPKDWETISAYQQLSESFIIKHKKRVNWLSIITFQNLSEEFVRYHIVGKYDIYYLPFASKLSERFIDEYAEELAWEHISRYQPLMNYSYDFIERYNDKLEWWGVIRRRDLSWTFIREFRHKFKKYPKAFAQVIQRHHQFMAFQLNATIAIDVVTVIFAFV